MAMMYGTKLLCRKKYSDKTVIIVYGGPKEQHELAVENAGTASVIEGSGVIQAQKSGYTIFNWVTSPDRKIVKVRGNVYIYMLGKNLILNMRESPRILIRFRPQFSIQLLGRSYGFKLRARKYHP
jgi:hypothetical protein